MTADRTTRPPAVTDIGPALGSALGPVLLGRVRDALARLGPVRPGELVMVAVSGGPDSVALLHLLVRLSTIVGFRVHVAHCDHGLRGAESAEDAGFVRRLGEAWAVPVTVGCVPAGTIDARGRGLQAAARDARYAFLRRTAEAVGARWVATAHTADDQAETVIMRWVRGAGLAGLAGIPTVRAPYIRPLLGVLRREVESYLSEIGIAPRRDPSNRNPRFLRVAVRDTVLPALRALNPRVVETIGRTAVLVAEDAAWLERCAEDHLARSVRDAGDGWIELTRVDVARLDPVLRRRVIRRALTRLRDAACGLSFEVVESVSRHAASSQHGRLAVGLGLVAECGAGRIRLAVESGGRRTTPEPVTLPWEGERELPEWGIVVAVGEEAGGEKSLAPHEAAFDIDRLPGMLAVRGRRPGDVFYPEGMSGRKRLQNFFVDTRVPRWRRDAVPLLVAGDELIWVIGARRDRRYLAMGSGRSVVVRVRQQRQPHLAAPAPDLVPALHGASSERP
ncbi:MAG: tRNA lysidine(34) synthetase TilS [Nitrospirae bacterium]|nr:tRNA lysidine(34) synthetase TilS [Nitrospirota bacterium]